MTVDLAALAKLASEATPGPWRWAADDYMGAWVVMRERPSFEADSPADAAYIAAASPDVVAALCRVAQAAHVIVDRPGVWDAGGSDWWDAHDALRAALTDLDR